MQFLANIALDLDDDEIERERRRSIIGQSRLMLESTECCRYARCAMHDSDPITDPSIA